MVRVGRRTFLRLAGASATAGALCKLGLTQLDRQPASEEQTSRPPRFGFRQLLELDACTRCG